MQTTVNSKWMTIVAFIAIGAIPVFGAAKEQGQQTPTAVANASATTGNGLADSLGDPAKVSVNCRQKVQDMMSGKGCSATAEASASSSSSSSSSSKSSEAKTEKAEKKCEKHAAKKVDGKTGGGMVPNGRSIEIIH